MLKSIDTKLIIEPLEDTFSICKVQDYSRVNLEHPFCFIGSTDEEKSLVCPLSLVPENVTERADGWRGFRIGGVLEFSLIGILSGILNLLAGHEISVFVISTFNTDYIFVQENVFNDAIQILKNAGYKVKDSEVSAE